VRRDRAQVLPGSMMRRRVILRIQARNVPAETPSILARLVPMTPHHAGGPPEVAGGRHPTTTQGNHRARALPSPTSAGSLATLRTPGGSSANTRACERERNAPRRREQLRAPGTGPGIAGRAPNMARHAPCLAHVRRDLAPGRRGAGRDRRVHRELLVGYTVVIDSKLMAGVVTAVLWLMRPPPR